jgi:hypothetical protein
MYEKLNLKMTKLGILHNFEFQSRFRSWTRLNLNVCSRSFQSFRFLVPVPATVPVKLYFLSPAPATGTGAGPAHLYTIPKNVPRISTNSKPILDFVRQYFLFSSKQASLSSIYKTFNTECLENYSLF